MITFRELLKVPELSKSTFENVSLDRRDTLSLNNIFKVSASERIVIKFNFIDVNVITTIVEDDLSNSLFYTCKQV